MSHVTFPVSRVSGARLLRMATCALLVLGMAPAGGFGRHKEAAQPPSAGDSTTAIGCLRSINTAEAMYAKTYKLGFSPTLKALGVPTKGVHTSYKAAGLLDESLTGGRKSNYVFAYTAAKPDAIQKINSYTVTARPAKWAAGAKSFFTNETGVIRSTEEDRAPAPGDPEIGH